MRAATDSMIAGTLIAAPRPATMDAGRPRRGNGELAVARAPVGRK